MGHLCRYGAPLIDLVSEQIRCQQHQGSELVDGSSPPGISNGGGGGSTVSSGGRQVRGGLHRVQRG